MIKGKTRIELTNVNTGEVEVIEKENMITNALQYIFNPLGYIKTSSTMYGSSFVNYYATLTGGLLLLDRTVTEDAKNIFLDTSVGLTGCAVFDQQNSSDQTLRGNYNATETEIDVVNRTIKYVYDFDTAEANGTIASVALTHAYGGYSNRGCAEEPVREEYPFFMNIGSGSLKLSSSSAGISAYDRTLSYSTYGANYKWIFLIDATKDMVYYFSIESTTSITIRGYRANINTVSLFDTPSTGRTLLFEKNIVFSTAISQQYFSYNYDEEAEKLYIISGANNNVSNGGAFTITEIDVANDYAVTQYAMTNKTGVTLRMFFSRDNTMCYDGYIYLMPYSGTYNIYREEIGNSANVQKIDTVVRQCWPLWAKDKRLYFGNPTSYSPSWALYIVETDSFTLKYPEGKYLYDSTSRQFVPVKGVPMTYFMSCGTSDGTFGMRTDYLATINNLESAVVKTADKTMKITYTLTEEAE
uniref:hypothetical protein n=1 Tax=Acetatifactor sp. TaxID=1872090 RepID=UPI004055A79E